ncbi:uncharacterized protein LOC129756719 isoform X2 [Uranotaenia lowii]|uniref:uncharacterized protein LOC129756719 isoform X2 n=1 Tax=Uranotaenia lowii TaxID=190385 RepID=UPI00247AC603|nr:uncharacterized protein LOC129756719 isoform X2 [Uranotaenia lowii]
MLRLLFLVALLTSPALSKTGGDERRRGLFRRNKPTTTTSTEASIVQEDSSSAESKYVLDNHSHHSEGLYTVGDSFTIGTGSSSGPSVSSSGGSSSFGGRGSGFKQSSGTIGDKISSYTDFTFGDAKLSNAKDFTSDEDIGLGFKNHKLPTTNANSYKSAGNFDFLSKDFLKPSLDAKPKTSFTSKFSISHPTPSKSSVQGKLDHLDDSTEYEIYSSLKSGSSFKSPYSKKFPSAQSVSPLTTLSGSSFSFEGNVKKLPSGFDDYGTIPSSGKTNKHKKNKLSLDDDTFGGSSAFGATGGSFGVGLLGKPEKASNPYSQFDTDNSGEGGFGNSKFKPYGKITSGSSSGFKNSFSLDNSDELDDPFAPKHKFPKPHSASASSSSFASQSLKPISTEFDTDFDLKNIQLPGAHNSKLRPNTFTKPKSHKSKLYGPNIDNPNPLEFKPNFKLQDVPNLYPAEHNLGAGIAAKGQIENFLNSKHPFGEPEPIKTTHFLDGNPLKKGRYPEFSSPSEEELVEKEALRAQIEYLKAQAAKPSRKRPGKNNGPKSPSFAGSTNQHSFSSSFGTSFGASAHGPSSFAAVSPGGSFSHGPRESFNKGPNPIPAHGPVGPQRGPRPVRRIPPLGIKGPHPGSRIPHFNDRPFSVSFKL